MRYLLPLIMLAGCGPIPVQISKQSQEQSQTASQTASTAADQQSSHQSSHASESKQGTNSMPIIVVCVQNNSGSSNCAVPKSSLSDILEGKAK